MNSASMFFKLFNIALIFSTQNKLTAKAAIYVADQIKESVGTVVVVVVGSVDGESGGSVIKGKER
jgi:hypothetical protein